MSKKTKLQKAKDLIAMINEATKTNMAKRMSQIQVQNAELNGIVFTKEDKVLLGEMLVEIKEASNKLWAKHLSHDQLDYLKKLYSDPVYIEMLPLLSSITIKCAEAGGEMGQKYGKIAIEREQTKLK